MPYVVIAIAGNSLHYRKLSVNNIFFNTSCK